MGFFYTLAIHNLNQLNMQSVTLGGDRLGSGNKMKVDLRTYDRSTHDLSEVFRSTMSPGTIVPFYKKLCLPGDKWEIELDINMLTHPTIGPLFGSYKVQLDGFIIPLRLYQAKLHMNMINIGRNMSQIKLPLIRLDAEIVDPTDANIDISQINPSCILAYLGIRGVGVRNDAVGDLQRYFNGTIWLGYWEVVKQYYSNKQEEIGAVIHSGAVTAIESVNTIAFNGDDIAADPLTGYVPITDAEQLELNYTGGTPPILSTVMLRLAGRNTRISLEELLIESSIIDDGISLITATYNFAKYGNIEVINWGYRTPTEIANVPPEVVTFPLENIDTMRQLILTEALSTSAFVINELSPAPQNIAPYNYINGKAGDYPYKMSSQEGLAVKTYQSDVNNNWVNTEYIDGAGGIAEITAVDTSSGEFTMDQLNLSKKVYDMLNRIAVSGGTYKDWIDVTYTESGAWRADSPVYLGSLIKEMVFQEVVSNAASSDQPLGTIAGKGVLSRDKHKGGYINFSVDEPSYLLLVVSITPRIDYSQGNDWDMHLLTMDDFHKPALDAIGFQELITEGMAWWDTYYDAVNEVWVQRSAGKQPAWVNYMTSVNKTYGNFAIPDNEMFMTLNRRYEAEADGTNARIADLTTYIDPVKYNTIFANTAIDAQNFWCQIRTDAKARRVMSGKLMPTV